MHSLTHSVTHTPLLEHVDGADGLDAVTVRRRDRDGGGGGDGDGDDNKSG